MKNIKYLFATIVLVLALTSCDSFLNQYPEGGVLLEEQFQNLHLFKAVRVRRPSNLR